MARLTPKHATTLVLTVALAGAVSACGQQSIDLEAGASANVQDGAQIFNDKCSGCHTLEASGSQGSAYEVNDRERVDGPNFNTRPQDKESVLYAIRNGGFSGAIMPENIVVGDDAEKVAEFLEEYAGNLASTPASPGSGGATP